MNIHSALAWAGLLMAASVAQAELRVFPASPRAGQEFVVQISQTGGCGPGSALRGEVSGSTISIAYEDAGVCFPERPPGEPPTSVVVRVPAAGVYEVRERGEYQGRVVTSISHGQVTVQAASTASRTTTSLAGMWYVPQQPGWGLSITEGESGQLFLSWFTYSRFSNGARALSSWYVVPSGTWTGTNEFAGPVYSAQGPALGTPFDPAAVRLTPVALATITAQAADSIIFSVQGNDGTPLIVNQGLTRFRF